MLFEQFECNIKILTVVKLNWEYSNAEVSPRNFNAFSFRTYGNAYYKTQEGECSANAGDILFVPENVGYHIQAEKEELYVIHFELPQNAQTNLEVFHIEDYTKAKKLFANCYETWTKKEPGYYFKTLSIFYNILGLILASSQYLHEDDSYMKLKPAIDYLHAHYTDSNLSVLSLCDVAKVSDTYLRKLFMKCYGMKPVKYINSLRIKYAKELLESGYYKVEDIAEMSGFEDTKYFSKVFKQYTGITPSGYRDLR